MAGLLYFLPNQQPSAAKLPELRKLGLGYAFDDHAGAAQVTRGPSGQAGLVVADKDTVPEQQRGYFPDRQQWRPIPNHPDGVHVGVSLGAEPKPAELARKTQLRGHVVKLADGKDWLAPVARRVLPEQEMAWFNALPRQVDVDANGEWTADEPLARYAPLWKTAIDWWDANATAEVSDASIKFEFAGLLDAAVLALQANYRVGKIECALLAMLTPEHARMILNALIDWPTIELFLQKKNMEE